MRIIGRHTDSRGRSTGERVDAVKRTTPLTDSQHARATRLLDSILDAASAQGVTLDDFDWIADMPGVCVDATRRTAQ